MALFKMLIKGEIRKVRLQRSREDGDRRISLVETMDGAPYGKHWVDTSSVEAALEGLAGIDVVEAAQETVAETAASGGEETVGEAPPEDAAADLSKIPIKDLNSVKPSWYKGLAKAGYSTVADVVEKGADGMTDVNGIGDSTAKSIYDEASEVEG